LGVSLGILFSKIEAGFLGFGLAARLLVTVAVETTQSAPAVLNAMRSFGHIMTYSKLLLVIFGDDEMIDR